METTVETKPAWDYEVALKQVETVDRKDEIILGRLATVDLSTGQPIGLVGGRYQLIQNKTINAVMTGLESSLGLTQKHVGVYRGKRIAAFRYGFDKSEVVIENSLTPEDKVNFGIEIINSFDMGLSRMIRAFAHRLVCQNGLTVPREVGRFSLNRLDGFNETVVKEELTKRLTPIIATANTWREWAKTEPSRIKVSDLINGHLPKKVAEQILSEYGNGKDKTIWGLYNQVTYYISHVAKSKDQSNLRVKQWELEALADRFYHTDLV
jgi:hypothetical protein